MSREELAVRGRNDGILPASKNEHVGLDAWKKRLQTRKVTRVGLDKRGGLRKPATDGRQSVILENRIRRHDGRRLGDELHGNITTLQMIESARRRFDEVLTVPGDPSTPRIGATGTLASLL